ncbi:MAG: glycosyltransferase [Ignavibacteriaceae bacterium]|nr:glycosyltransferase [Ignavibacteriaceae bacterium]
MRIILFSNLFPNKSFPTYGIFNLSRARALKNLGNDVLIIAPISLNPHMEHFFPKLKIKELVKYYSNLLSVPKIEFNSGIKIIHPKWIKAPNKLFSKYHAAVLHFFIGRETQKIINYFRPDLIISTWLNPFSVYSKYIPKKSEINYFALAEGSDVLIDSTKFKGWAKLEKTINENCDLVIAVSSMMKTQMLSKTELQKVKIIRNGYDGESFNFKENCHSNSGENLNILHVGGFYSVKGQDILLKALLYSKRAIKLTLVGTGPELDKCQQFVKDNKLEKHVLFLGQISHSDIPYLLRKNDIFCMPSRSEGLPAAPLEAMACGLPVVGTNVGGMREIIKDGFNGYLCAPDSPEDLMEKIILASNTKWDRLKISEWVKNNFSWNTWAKNIINEYSLISHSMIS